MAVTGPHATSVTSSSFAVYLAAAILATGTIPVAVSASTVEPDTPVSVNSAELASTLVKRMQARGLNTFAARDPETPDRYVAAMVFPGVQILLMSARSEATAYMEAQLAAGEYNNVYMALQQGIAESKIFFQDMGADGLQALKGSVPDVMYERGTEQTLLDGDWKTAKMSQSAYRKLVKDADDRYSRYLSILINALSAAENR